ncbi:MAG: hypothetical protein GY841_20890 [FCB group bacterium]|nr:hypothetical protein [FCB group bacterium]
MSALILLGITGCERKVTNEVTKIIAADDAAYKGSEACQACHSEIYADFRNTGHPFKLNEADSAFLPIGAYYPYATVPLPSDLSEADVSMIIGGFRWKARYIDNEGYILTGDERQYNFATEEFVAYSGSTAPRKPYDCGPCHMTDYESGGHQNGIEGLVGTWAFNGVQCEECHGPGELHIGDPSNVGMVIDRSAQGCGKCHIRGVESEIPASGGFIKHHEQWNEMFTTKHAVLDCIDCHDVHKGLHPNNPEREDAIINKCEDCHFEETESFVNSSINHNGSSVGPDCIDCHMARAAKSAVALGPYEGDIRSHLFRINTDADAEMFNDAGTLANGYLTLEYTCLTCHASEDKAWAATYAESVHADDDDDDMDYVGSPTCEACHSTIYANFRNSGHPYKLNDVDSAFLPAGEYYPYTSVPLPPDLTEDDVSMIIGGFRWKARYIDNDGYILTGDDRQYNFATDEFVAYSGSTAPKKPYDCGPCHMTDYKSIGNQNDKEGLVGTWEFNGVQCEECHGPGNRHVADAFTNKMTIDRTAEQCGKCHVRGDPAEIPASGGFIRHHEQWNEMFTTKHSSFDCVDCHDPHMGLHADNPDRALAIKIKCENCHFAETQSFMATIIDDHISDSDGPGCIDCHMPRAAKSATGDLATFTGDIRSHLMRINTDADAEMFNADSTLANGYLTVDYVCLQCHTGEDKAWALTNAGSAHNSSAAVSSRFEGISLR